jgi:hypothetical protein
VTVLVVSPEKWAISPHGEEPGADIALYLARHGVTVRGSPIRSMLDVAICAVAPTLCRFASCARAICGHVASVLPMNSRRPEAYLKSFLIE